MRGIIHNLMLTASLLGVFPALAAAQTVCVGDCRDDGQVTVDEVVTMVTIALGTIEFDLCSRSDSNGDRKITVDEILTAITNALNGCPAPPPTPTLPPASRWGSFIWGVDRWE